MSCGGTFAPSARSKSSPAGRQAKVQAIEGIKPWLQSLLPKLPSMHTSPKKHALKDPVRSGVSLSLCGSKFDHEVHKSIFQPFFAIVANPRLLSYASSLREENTACCSTKLHYWDGGSQTARAACGRRTRRCSARGYSRWAVRGWDKTPRRPPAAATLPVDLESQDPEKMGSLNQGSNTGFF